MIFDDPKVILPLIYGVHTEYRMQIFWTQPYYNFHLQYIPMLKLIKTLAICYNFKIL